MDILSNSKAHPAPTYYQPSYLRFRHIPLADLLQSAYQNVNGRLFLAVFFRGDDAPAGVVRGMELAPALPPS
jgi:hypothetical protein